MKFENTISAQDVRNFLSKSDIATEEIKTFGKDGQFLVRLKDTANFSSKLSTGMKANLPTNSITILQEDTISAKIGKEMRINAFIAIILSIIAILLYVAFRFEFVYGVGAIVAMIHDVIFTFTLTVIVHHLGIINLEFSQQILAAMLTVIGFSVNDTVIVFDRIRENKTKHKGMNFVKMVNLSINETLSRTINTVLTVVLVLVAMVFLAGPVLQGFAFTMLIGIIIGTYSSIYIASSGVIYWLEKVHKISFEQDHTTEKITKAAKI